MTIKEKLTPKNKKNISKILNVFPDSLVIHLQYYASLGRILNLRKPERFTEKMQWYKLNYKNPLMTICADKFRVRDYIVERGYEDNIPNLYGVYDSFEEINFDNLPKSFAIKCNNGSGTNIFIKDKTEMNIKDIELTIRSWKNVNTLSIGREWVYKGIEQKIVIEELLVPKDDFQKKYGLNDYKVMCFNGNSEYIWVDINREQDHNRNFYDLNWKQLNVKSDKPVYPYELKKPVHIEKMIEISNKFAKEFPFVRVDFYELNNQLYIGELTFYPWSGCVKFEPDEFDYTLGKKLNLPKNKKNGGLYESISYNTDSQ